VCNQHSFLATYVQSHALQPRTYLFLCVICIFCQCTSNHMFHNSNLTCFCVQSVFFVSVHPITRSIFTPVPLLRAARTLFCQGLPTTICRCEHPRRVLPPWCMVASNAPKTLAVQGIVRNIIFLMYSHTLSSDQKTMGFIYKLNEGRPIQNIQFLARQRLFSP